MRELSKFQAGFAAVLCIGAVAEGAINIELRPSFQSVGNGTIFGVGVYAVSDSASNQSMSAIDLIFGWQPSYLQMMSNSNVGAVPMLASTFITPGLYSLNESAIPQDGDAIYTGFAGFGTPVVATPAGVLLTTFRFKALLPTAFTPINLLTSGGTPVGFTTVFDGTVPNLNVTGSLSGAGVEIVPGPGVGAVVGLAGVVAARRRRR